MVHLFFNGCKQFFYEVCSFRAETKCLSIVTSGRYNICVSWSGILLLFLCSVRNVAPSFARQMWQFHKIRGSRGESPSLEPQMSVWLGAWYWMPCGRMENKFERKAKCPDLPTCG